MLALGELGFVSDPLACVVRARRLRIGVGAVGPASPPLRCGPLRGCLASLGVSGPSSLASVSAASTGPLFRMACCRLTLRVRPAGRGLAARVSEGFALSRGSTTPLVQPRRFVRRVGFGLRGELGRGFRLPPVVLSAYASCWPYVARRRLFSFWGLPVAALCLLPVCEAVACVFDAFVARPPPPAGRCHPAEGS